MIFVSEVSPDFIKINNFNVCRIMIYKRSKQIKYFFDFKLNGYYF